MTTSDPVANTTVANTTLAFLAENYPSIIPHVPEEVLAFGMPNFWVCVIAAFIIGVFLLASAAGNILMIFLFVKWVC